MRCIICDTKDQWENVDKYRFKEQGMAICKSCGFISYPEKYQTLEEIKRYYENDYRKCPSINNYFTGFRKLHIHSAMLTEYMNKWKEDKKESPVVGEIGAAFGMFLNWVQKHFPKADLNGTEWTRSFRRVAFHEYGIDLKSDFDTSKKYDLITSFKVAEHQMDADKYLREYVECLKDDGLFYISVPTWFEAMENFGADGFDLEFYFSPNHINVWTKSHFEYLLKKVGLKIIKEDHYMYGNSYICQRDDSLMSTEVHKENVDDLKRKLEKIKKAAEFFMKGNFDEAVNLWPNFPSAWVNRFEKNRALGFKDSQGMPPFEWTWKNSVENAMKSCPDNFRVFQLQVDCLMRYERFKEAISCIQKGLELKPNQASLLLALSHCFRQLGLRCENPKERMGMFQEAREICKYLASQDPQTRNEVITWAYSDAAEIPTPLEIGK